MRATLLSLISRAWTVNQAIIDQSTSDKNFAKCHCTALAHTQPAYSCVRMGGCSVMWMGELQGRSANSNAISYVLDSIDIRTSVGIPNTVLLHLPRDTNARCSIFPFQNFELCFTRCSRLQHTLHSIGLKVFFAMFSSAFISLSVHTHTHTHSLTRGKESLR